MEYPVIAAIRRLTLHDGPGTRTTVFVKGCPLRCIWCHNPETFSPGPQLLFHSNLCSNCRKCEKACSKAVHHFTGSGHFLERNNCSLCGACVEACLRNALDICGREYAPEELLEILLKDKKFYDSGGGVTVSGGEPLLYPDFIRELFMLLRKHQIHTALDTCGHVPFGAFEKVLPFTDMILFDLKGMDDSKHLVNTGRSNRLILENLKKTGSGNIPVEIRMPIVPGCNDSESEFHAAGKFLQPLQAIKAIRLLPYHSMAREKYAAAGQKDTMPQSDPPAPAKLKAVADILQQYVPAAVLF